MNNQDIEDVELYQLPSIDSIHEEVTIDIEPMDHGPDRFDANLADILPENVLNKIAGRLVDDIEADITSRDEWSRILEKGMDQMGLNVEDMSKDNTFPFQNACGVYSQVMVQGMVEFCAQAIAELLPVEGPVKELIIGDTTEALEEQAKRVETFANYFFTQMAPEFYPDMKKMMPWVYLAGSSVRKVYFDPILKRPTSRFIKSQNFIVDNTITSLADGWRMTEIVDINAIKLQREMQLGTYRDIDISPVDESDEQSNLDRAVDRSEGINRVPYDEAIEYQLYECHTYLDMEEIEEMEAEADEVNADSSYRPYKITIHKDSHKILAIYRNWREGDPEYKRKDYYVDYGYVDGFGFYKLGAAHLLGGIAKACTTLLRQYIDGMTLANFPGGMHIKGMRLTDNNIRIGPTEFIPVDTGGLSIRDSIMLMPYKEPSPGINEMRKELEMAAGKIMGAANQQMGEFNPQAPVGTTYALLDMINLVQSTVIRSLRDSMAAEFKLFYALFAETLPVEQISFDAVGGSTAICAADFSENIKLVPIADPHVTTKMQRLMRAQTIVEMSNVAPDLYDRREAQLNYLKEIKIPASLVKKLLPDKDELPPVDPVTENQNIMIGKPVKAHLDQDHRAHRIVVQSLMNQPGLPPQVVAAAAAHDMEHQALEFQIQMQQGMGIQLPANPEEIPQDMQNQIAMMAADVISQQAQQQQQMGPPPPLDPAAVMLEDVKVKEMAVQQRAKSDELRAQTEAFKAQLANETKMKELEIKLLELEQKMKEAELNVQAKAFEVQMKANNT